MGIRMGRGDTIITRTGLKTHRLADTALKRFSKCSFTVSKLRFFESLRLVSTAPEGF